MSTTNETMPENEQLPTVVWYKEQVRKLGAIRAFLISLEKEDSGGDECIIDWVKRVVKQLQAELAEAKDENEKPIQIKLFRICCHCNKEFEVETTIIVTEAVKGITGHVANFLNCPLCKKRNDIWVRVQVQKESKE